MPTAKTATLTLRIDPSLKKALRGVADRDRRRIANMIEVMIREYCKQKGAPVSEQRALFFDK